VVVDIQEIHQGPDKDAPMYEGVLRSLDRVFENRTLIIEVSRISFLLDWLARYGQIDWSPAVVDGSSIRAVLGPPRNLRGTLSRKLSAAVDQSVRYPHPERPCALRNVGKA